MLGGSRDLLVDRCPFGPQSFHFTPLCFFSLPILCLFRFPLSFLLFLLLLYILLRRCPANKLANCSGLWKEIAEGK